MKTGVFIPAIVVIFVLFVVRVQCGGKRKAGCPFRNRNSDDEAACGARRKHNRPSSITRLIHQASKSPRREKRQTSLEECQKNEVECDQNMKYRSITGWCNNLDHPEWGSAYSMFERMMGNTYDNQTIFSPRAKGVDGSPLPSPRKIATTVHELTNIRECGNPNLPESCVEHAHMLMQWGQFLAHDFVFTPAVDKECDGCSRPDGDADDCFPIPIPDDDPIFEANTCMSFTRASNGNLDSSGTREALNEITSFIDASNLYGSEVSLADSLRTKTGGRMKLATEGTQAESLLPEDPDQSGCSPASTDGGCFWAGDKRNSVTQGLASMHTFWIREHNSIADTLAANNPTWNDERIYQETRAIVGALNQRITYKEFLPIIIGQQNMADFGIEEDDDATRNSVYDTSRNPTIPIEFAGAAFRFGHSLIDNRFIWRRLARNQTRVPAVVLEGHFFEQDFLYADSLNVGSLLKGMTTQVQWKLDRFIDKVMRDQLFEVAHGSAFDIASLNIQRGRDLGLPSYNAARMFFNLTPNITRFSDLQGPDETGLMRGQAETRLRTSYAMLASLVRAREEISDGRAMATVREAHRSHSPAIRNYLPGSYERSELSSDVNDIDLWVGIISEMPVTDNVHILGPTGSRIVGEVFKNLKEGDRFFYSNTEAISPGSFSDAQLQEIRNMKFSNILCHHLGPDALLQPHIFYLNQTGNLLASCSEYPYLNLDLWTDNPESAGTFLIFED